MRVAKAHRVRQLVLFAVGLVPLVGCFGKIREDPPDVVNVNTQQRPVPPPPSRPPPPPRDPPDPPTPEGCMAFDPIDASTLPWAPPTPTQAGACTTEDVSAFQTYVDGGNASTTQDLVDFVKKRSATCAACIFTDTSASTWGPIPLTNGEAYTVNVGACWALVSGDVACGKAAQNQLDCTYAACQDCYDDTQLQTCLQEAAKGVACSDEATAFQKACGPYQASAGSKCADFYGSIRVQCVSGP